ncbi:hypothetical protein SLA2020_068650 [Shorea laevis]
MENKKLDLGVLWPIQKTKGCHHACAMPTSLSRSFLLFNFFLFDLAIKTLINDNYLLNDAHFHGACFFNYEAWVNDLIHIGPSASVVGPIVGQEIINGDVGGGIQGMQIPSKHF